MSKIEDQIYYDIMGEFWKLHLIHKFDLNITNEGNINSITLPTKDNLVLTINLPNILDKNINILLTDKLKELKELFN